MSPDISADCVGYEMNVLDRTIRHEQAVLVFIILFILCCAFDDLFHRGYVFGMDPLKKKFDGGLYGSIVGEDAIGLLGPVKLSA